MIGRAMLGALRKGYHAQLCGKTRDANPYMDIRNNRNHVTFSRAFRRHWDEGFRLAEQGRPRP